MPGFEARRLCPDGVFLRGDMKRYTRESKRIFQVFARFTPRVEGLSLDEAFLDLTGSERLLGPPVRVAERLRREVREETGLAVSVGIAPVKMVAKIASDLAKPDGLLEVPRDRVREFLAPLPVGRIWGVGPVAQSRLHEAGIETIGDLADHDPQRLRRLLGDFGPRVSGLARGRDLREVDPYREAVSISEENTFSGDVSDRAVLEKAILAHAEAVARRLRRSKLVARTVLLKLKLSRRVAAGPRGYPLLTRRCTLPEPTDDGAELTRSARELLSRADLQEPVRLLGVGVTGLRASRREQLSLFGPERDRSRRSELNRALDALNDRFGSGAVRRATQEEVSRAGLSHQIKRGGDDDEPDELAGPPSDD